MFVAVVRITLRLPSRDLKARRAIVRSVVERLRNRFNATVADAGPGVEPAVAIIAAACLSNEAAHATGQVQAIVDSIADWRLDAELIDIETELIPC
jgi:uncharacterized protein YlxP (DUF503 family)